jgi:excisionase family DNA binding protein
MVCLTLSRREACALIGISIRTSYRMQGAGEFPAHIRGLPHRFSRRLVEQFIEGHHRAIARERKASTPCEVR